MKTAWIALALACALVSAWFFSRDGVGENPVPHVFDNMSARSHPDAQAVDETGGRRHVRLVPAHAVAQRMNGNISSKKGDERSAFPGESSYFISGRPQGGDEETVPPELGGISRSKDVRAEGRALYMAHCAVCHGANGDGKGAMAAYKEYPGIGDFRDSKYDIYTPGKMFRSIRAGQGNMPRYGHVLTAREIWCLVELIRQMQGETTNHEAQE